MFEIFKRKSGAKREAGAPPKEQKEERETGGLFGAEADLALRVVKEDGVDPAKDRDGFSAWLDKHPGFQRAVRGIVFTTALAGASPAMAGWENIAGDFIQGEVNAEISHRNAEERYAAEHRNAAARYAQERQNLELRFQQERARLNARNAPPQELKYLEERLANARAYIAQREAEHHRYIEQRRAQEHDYIEQRRMAARVYAGQRAAAEAISQIFSRRK